MNKLATALTTLVLLTAAWPMMGASAQTSAPPMAFGMEAGAIQAQTDAGVAPDIGTFWVGPWTLKHGWGGPDGQMDKMRQAGVTPAIHFYYWGDDISQSCIANGCYSDLHGSWKDQAGWNQLANELVQHLNAKMGGEPVYILLETEFNKADLQYHEPLDEMLAQKAEQIKAGYPEAEIVLSLGNWNRPAWTTWDRAAAASDMIGIQGMRGSTRDSVSHYDSLYEQTLAGAKDAKRYFAKPVIIQDLALSSYPEPEYVEKQRAELAQFFDNIGELKAAGVEALVYRSWINSVNMDLKNYYGQAERHWGLNYAGSEGGGAKPAGHVWINGVKAERAGSSPGSPAQAPAFAASFAPSANNNEWWVDVKVTANQHPVKVEASHNGGSYVNLDKTSWGTWAKSFRAPAGGEMVYRATDAHGQEVVSEPFPWLKSANTAPTANFAATTSPLTVSLDAGGSSDPDGDALTYEWAMGDGSAATGRTASHTYAAAGTYMVKLTVSDGQATGSTSQSVTVTAPPAFTASFAPSANNNEWWVDVKVSSSHAPVKVEASHNGGSYVNLEKTSWGTWAKSFRAPAGGEMVYRATDAYGQVVSEPFPWLKTNTAPAASFTASTSALGLSVDASGSSDADGDALSYAWDFGNGVTATGKTASHTYGASGTYMVKLTVSDGQATGIASKQVTVQAPNAAPVAAFAASGSGLRVDVDASGSSDADGDALSYAWDFGNGATATGKTASHTYGASGTYMVKLTVSDGKATGSTSKSITAKAPFAATFEPTSGINEWWVDVKVGSASPVSKVEAKAGTGSWMSLDKTSWGTWAKSFHVPAGTPVAFRATDNAGQSVVSESMPWMGKESLSVVFTPKAQDNRWWVEVAVDANQDIAQVHVRKNGGTWMPMDKQSWGTYAESFNAHKAQIEFRATSVSGERATSKAYTWG